MILAVYPASLDGRQRKLLLILLRLPLWRTGDLGNKRTGDMGYKRIRDIGYKKDWRHR
jgi:hypothetical protein